MTADAGFRFIENRGQLDPRVRFYTQGAAASLYFTDRGVRMSLSADGMSEPVRGAGNNKRWVIDHAFLGTDSVRPVATRRSEMSVSYFKGDRADWYTGLPTFGRIIYRNVWPGVDIRYSGTGNTLKYDAIVHPGADPEAIALIYRHARSVQETAQGTLQVTTGLGSFTEEAPIAYQHHGRTRRDVPAGFEITRRGYGFHLGDYDASRTLIIDPEVLIYAGYIGGSAGDTVTGIAVDSDGSAYVTGFTDSSEATFPKTGGPDATFGGASDAFVVKVTADGSALAYAGYIGGSGVDRGYGIAVDSDGNAYVTGFADSSAATFPVTNGPDLTNGGSPDAFVAKVTADGSALAYAGYIGGNGSDRGYGIAVDPDGNAYVTGSTSSSAATFPTTGGPGLSRNGITDAFVAKVTADGLAFAYAGFIGGSGQEEGRGIAVDSSGNAYVTGRTFSDQATFPETSGSLDTTYNGGTTDAFVGKVAADGLALTYAGYIGGSSEDSGYGIAVDSSGNAYVTGYTSSDEATFPVTTGSLDTTYNGGTTDAFVGKVAADGSALTYAGYIGGSGADANNGFGDYLGGIAVDSSGNAYVTGTTGSDEMTFPVIGGPDLTYGGSDDAFVAKVAASGSALTHAGYIGGIGQDAGHGIAVDSSGNAYVGGYTASDEMTFPVIGGPDPTSNGGPDGFVAKVGESNVAPTCANDSAVTDEDQLLEDSVTCSDTEGDTLSYSLEDDVTNGTLTFNSDGSFEYDPDPGFTGDDSFTFTANDGQDSNVATFVITVTPRPTGGGGGGGPNPTPTPSPSATPTPSVSPTPTPQVSPTPTPQVLPTPTPQVSPSPTASNPTPSVSPSPTASVSPSPTTSSPPDPIETTCGGHSVTIQVSAVNQTTSGTEGDDVIRGTDGTDTIHGAGGNDIICGLGGNDRLYGDARIDTIYGGSGRDKVYGGSGTGGGTYGDRLYGGPGKDLLAGDGGADHLEGGRGDDRLYGNAGKDDLFGNAGKDSLNGGVNTDRCEGGAGIDTGTRCEPFLQ